MLESRFYLMKQIFSCVALVVLAATSALAQNIPASPSSQSMVHPFGPRTFLKSQGSPRARDLTFEVPDTSGTYYLTVVKRSDRAKARIKVNGQAIFRPGEFSRDRLVYRKLINVQAQNTLKIVPLGPKDSMIEVLISGVCSSNSLPIEKRNIAHNQVVWEQTFQVNQPAVVENIAAQLNNLNGLFWLETVNGDAQGQNKVRRGEVCFGDDHCLSNSDIRANSVRVPFVPDTVTDLRVDLKRPAGGQMTLRIVAACVQPDSSPQGPAPVLAAARSSGAGGFEGIEFNINDAILLDPCGSTQCFDFEYAGVLVGSLKLRMTEGVTENAAFYESSAQTSSVFVDQVEGEDPREVKSTFTFCMQGNAAGKAEFEIVECIIVEGEVQSEEVIDKITIVVKDFDFTIDGQCPSRNCPSTDECGPIGCLKQDGYAMLLSQGLFQPSFSVLPSAMGRNGLSPSWLLRYSSRAHSCGGHFGTTAFSLPCFERLRKDGSGNYVYQENKIREFVFSDSISNSALTGWTAEERYEVLLIPMELVVSYICLPPREEAMRKFSSQFSE